MRDVCCLPGAVDEAVTGDGGGIDEEAAAAAAAAAAESD